MRVSVCTFGLFPASCDFFLVRHVSHKNNSFNIFSTFFEGKTFNFLVFLKPKQCTCFLPGKSFSECPGRCVS